MGNMITSESYDQFSKRVNFTIENYSIEEIDKIIKSMLNRIKKILQRKRSTPAVLVFFLLFCFSYIYIYIIVWICMKFQGEKYSADYIPHETKMKADDDMKPHETTIFF